MPNKLFGIADPYYDALRVQSNQAIWPDAGGSTSGTGGILENKIYLWPADGSTISTFDATETGLNDSLAASVSGDSVWRPSIPIACTAGITVPAGVALVGISENAILSFSGFDGPAVTLGSGAKMLGGQVLFSVTGAVGVGIDNQAADTVVEHVHVEVSGATLNNIRFGKSTLVVASEVWAGYVKPSVGNVLIYSKDFDFTGTGNAATWYAYTSWPTGFDSTSSKNYYTFDPLGTEFFIGGNLTGIWRCTNQAAIRANPATNPTWNKILSVGDVITGSRTVTSISPMQYWNDRLVGLVRVHSGGGDELDVGEYVSGSWTWYAQGDDATTPQYIQHEYLQLRAAIDLSVQRIRNPLTGTTYHDYSCGGTGSSNVQSMYRNHDPATSKLYTVWSANSTDPKIVDALGNVLKATGLAAGKLAGDGQVTGSILGSSVFVCMQDGELFVSTDGLTFTQKATYKGVYHDTYKSSGGYIVRAGLTGNTGDPIYAISLDGGSTWSSKIGNLWTATGASALSLSNMELIFLG